MIGVTGISFLCAENKENLVDGRSKIKFIVGVIAPLASLVVFKYLNFFVTSFCTVFQIINNCSLKIILPVGISFYTFQSLSYVIDVYRGKQEKEKDFLEYALYISFFPQLVAGPIVLAGRFLPQLKQYRKLKLYNIEIGVQIFLFGLFKKIVLADNLSVFVDDVFRSPQLFNSATIWLAAISYTLQIYLDFSGYSDMAIGCAKCMGFDLCKNFDLPYLSKNISEFWKRWHISLSTWLKDYLYIPLGGNRKGTVRTYVNLLLTMLIGGLWHGSSWTFVAWGGLHGVALCLDKLRMKFFGSKRMVPFIRTCLGILCTDLVVCLLWIFFRAESFSVALSMLQGMFCPQQGIQQMYSWSFVALVLFAAYVFIAYRKSKKADKSDWTAFYPIFDLSTIKGLLIFFVTLFLTLGLAYVQSNPFIYFQF